MPHPPECHPGFAARLIAWYQEHHRDLPWRRTRDPYPIWLSEIMLQQTQVKTVLEYYRRFLEKYPTVRDLADAPLADVLKQWEGLGYYARCRNLHKAARIIVQDHGGVFPQTLEAVEKLPGIGRSTAGAILTFSAGQRHPLLDGNVKRVLSRVFDIADDIAQAGPTRRMWQHSADLLAAAEDPYTFNQAIMELGALICLPQAPRCMLCPVQTHCLAFSRGTQAERPVKAARKALPHHVIAVGVLWHEGRVFIQQRPEEGLLGGLWEFPGGKREPGESLEATVQREIREELGLDVSVEAPVCTVKHAYTHFRITLHAYHCRYLGEEPRPAACQRWQWVSPGQLEEFAFPKANKTVLEAVVAAWRKNEALATPSS